MDEKIFQAALAGLLHDIGKFAGRGEPPGVGQGIEAAGQGPGDDHIQITERVLPEIVPAPWRPMIQEAVGHQQQPESHLGRAIALASLLSVGEEPEVGSPPPAQLQSIFGSITGLVEQGQPVRPPQDWFVPLGPLEIREEIILKGESTATWATLWAQFKGQAQTLRQVHEGEAADRESYLASLLKLMQRYTWCIPAGAYPSGVDVSLYDYSRTTAALAACLIDLPETKLEELWQNPAQPEPVALLAGGDISGVQKFIYTITSRGATSALRGRSMYLQLLTELAARYALRAASLPLTNLLYAGGGHFYLLAPLSSRERLAEAQRTISRVLVQHHGGDLYLALAAEELYADAFRGPAFAERWRGLTQKLQGVKQRQFSELDEDTIQYLFQPQEHGGNEEKLCAVCQREHPQAKPGEENEPRKCPACVGFEALGQDLRQARYLCLDEIEPQPVPPLGGTAGDWQAVLGHLGFRASLHRQPPGSRPGTIRRHLLAIADDALAGLQPGPRQVIGRHLLVNVTPILTQAEHADFQEEIKDLPAPGSVKPFEVMAEQSQGTKRLGVLRMDVDSLGQIFSAGLGEKSALARVAALSFALTLFFEGWAGRIGAKLNEAAGRDLVYSIYSGGDDLFFVGAWDRMPVLAETIRDDLARYTGGHPGIHLSGGIALVGGKYPLYQAAEDALEAEHAAKTERQAGGATKNALNFLKKTVPWARFPEIKGRQEQLVKLVKPAPGQPVVPRSLIQRLSQIYAEYEDANRKRPEEGRVYWGPWHWHAAYSLSRLAKRYGHAEAEILEIRQQLSLENFTNIEWIGLAARWAELLVRD